MPVKWNPNTILKNIQSSVQGDYAPAYFAEPMRNLRDAFEKGSPEIVTEFRWLSIWYSNSGTASLFTDVDAGIPMLHQSVYFAAANIAFLSRRWVALAGNSGRIDDSDAALSVARAISLGCTNSARQMAGDLLTRPGFMDDVRREQSVLPQFVFNLCALAGLIPSPSGVYSIPVGEPYGSLLRVLREPDIDTITQPTISACDYHVAQCRSMNNKETPEFHQMAFRLNPVEILAFLRIRELFGLQNPDVDHPILKTAAGRLYPPLQVEPDPIIEPALKCALAQIEQEKKRRGIR